MLRAPALTAHPMMFRAYRRKPSQSESRDLTVNIVVEGPVTYTRGQRPSRLAEVLEHILYRGVQVLGSGNPHSLTNESLSQ